MKLWKWILKCPLLFLLLAGWIGLTAYTWSEGKLDNVLERDIIREPVFTALLEPDIDLPGSTFADLDDLQTLADTDLGDDVIEDLGKEALDNADADPDGTVSTFAHDKSNSDDGQSDGTDLGGADGAGTDGSMGEGSGADGNMGEGSGADGQTVADGTGDGQNAADGTGDGQDAAVGPEEEAGITRFKKYKKKKTDSQYYSDPGKKALTTDYAYQKVDKSYFDDAVFIGDSRTVGMQDYSGLDNATFFAKTGLNVYELLEDKFIKEPSTGKDVSVAHMLKEYQYGKIYLMIGINELGTGNTGTFQKAYDRVIRKFRKWQPDAVIYIQGIIPVSKAKAAEDSIFNNVNINDKNVAIAQLADGINVFYLDVSKKLTDKHGCLKADYTFDEVHMYAQYYGLWTDYLMEHAVVRE